MTEQPLPVVNTASMADIEPVAVARGRLDDAELRQLLAGLTAEFRYLMGSSTADAYLGWLTQALDPVTYDDARVFGPAGDLRWRREEWLDGGQLMRGWRAVFVGGRAGCPMTPLPEDVLDLAGHEQKPLNALLWGERRTGQSVWLEPRIPRPLDYSALVPGDPARVGLVAIQYIKQGQIDFVRLLGFSRWPQEMRHG